jgi:hypothetical protein
MADRPMQKSGRRQEQVLPMEPKKGIFGSFLPNAAIR